MSGHPSFIPKAGGGPRRGPGGHGHGPGGHGPAARMMGGETALAFGPTMKRMLAFMGQFKGRLLLVFLFAIASTAFSIVGPKVLSEATTVLFDGAVASAAGTGSIDFDAIGRILLATLALYLLSAACSWVQSWVMSYVSQQTCYRLRDAIEMCIRDRCSSPTAWPTPTARRFPPPTWWPCRSAPCRSA